MELIVPIVIGPPCSMPNTSCTHGVQHQRPDERAASTAPAADPRHRPPRPPSELSLGQELTDHRSLTGNHFAVVIRMDVGIP